MGEKRHCPECGSHLNRRDFVKVTGAAALAAGTANWLASHPVWAAPTKESAAETTVGRFFNTLSEQQRQAICLPWDHENRTKINANWHIAKPTIGSDFYNDEQREMITEIFRGVSSEDGFERFQKQMEEDSGGMQEYSVAIFGEPGSGKFEWAMTGRHLTIRADGDSVENMAFGGPIVYGHGEEVPSQNLFYYQTKQANAVFESLNPEQRKLALLANAPAENNVPLQGNAGKFPGIAIGELAEDQRQLFETVVKSILAPYRKEDVEEAMAVLKQGGGLEKLHMAFYQEDDIENDKVWDIWRVEGPTFVSHFRGAPHVHAYVNIGIKPA